ncbi:MAG: hypothetical protein LC126_30185 [Bryobacterales bacterium]|nr:hypothetical protein [Bryobacterales bacterium]
MIIAKYAIFTAALAAYALAAPAGIAVVPGGRRDIGLTAMTSSGEGYLAARETRVDIAFPDGRSGRGTLYVVFEPSTKCFLQTIFWAQKAEYPSDSWFNSIARTGGFIVSHDRLVLVTLKDPRFPYISILESSPEEADNLDDAESRSVRWYRDHLSALEARKYTPESFGYVVEKVAIWVPSGFFESDLNMDARGHVPLKFLNIARVNDSEWTVTLESTENPRNHRRLQVPIYKRPDTNSPGKPNKWIGSFPPVAR